MKNSTLAWEQRKLGQCFLERNERSDQGELISVTLNLGVVKAETLNRKDNSSQDKSNYKKVEIGDIAYNSMRMWQGASGVSSFSGILSPAYTVLVPLQGISSLFFSYQFKRENILKLFQASSQGLTSDTWNLKYSQIKEITMYLPKLEEQRKIGTFFKQLDDTIANHQCTCLKYENIKKAYLKIIFSDYFAKNRVKNTYDWEQGKFSELLDRDNGIRRGPFGSALKKELFVKKSKYVVYEQQNAIYDKYEIRYFISKKTFNELRKFTVSSGDFLMSGAGTIGKISRVPNGIATGVFNQALIRLKIDSNKTDSEYFLQLMRSKNMQERLTDANPGSAITNLVPMHELKNWDIFIPKLEEQRKIGTFFKQLDDTIANHQRELEKYQKIKTACLAQLFISPTTFTKEIKMKSQTQSEEMFELEVIDRLCKHGWERNESLYYKTEDDLLAHWRTILFERNRDLLDDVPLSDGEFQYIKQQIFNVKNPVEAGKLLAKGTLELRRDVENYEGVVKFIKFFWGHDVGSGKNSYEVVRQIRRPASKQGREDHRFDVTLLISGIPIIHIELKREGVGIKAAYNQIREYAEAGDFSGFFSLIQIFAILDPNESRYFANPGDYQRFNYKFCFGWADFENQKINSAATFIRDVLSVPMGHKLASLYTICDKEKNTLKVLRSYQIYAVEAILDKLRKSRFDGAAKAYLGGYVWHTTGSGKTMTSFKTAELASRLTNIDKVVFLADRNELVKQTSDEYSAFSENDDDITNTKNTYALLTALSSNHDPLIVTSIQKMNNVAELPAQARMQKKRMAFIVDEAHRSTSGDMLINIRKRFPDAVWFGFTGTPLLADNSDIKTSDLFGDALHIYSVADGIIDGNVLPFDVRKNLTLDSFTMRERVAEMKDPSRGDLYKLWLNSAKKSDLDVENAVPTANFEAEEHHKAVIKDIMRKWQQNSVNGVFSAMLTVPSIKIANEYFALLSDPMLNTQNIKFAMIYDNNDLHRDESLDYKLQLEKSIQQYNHYYGTAFGLDNVASYKTDLMDRLARRYQYANLEPAQKLDLIIVVYQLLTGFDAPYLNTIYVDKLMDYANLVQAFSRTNRILNDAKPHGIVEYYYRPEKMENNIKKAFELYANKNAEGIMYADSVAENIAHINDVFSQICTLFPEQEPQQADFSHTPEEVEQKKQFATWFNDFEHTMIKLRQQGVDWEKPETVQDLIFSENDYELLKARYQDLSDENKGTKDTEVKGKLDIEPLLVQQNRTVINEDYFTSLLNKYSSMVRNNQNHAETENLLEQIHQLFNKLPEKDRQIAEMILLDISRQKISEILSFQQLLDQYRNQKESDSITQFIQQFGLDKSAFIKLLNHHNYGEDDWGAFGLLDDVLKTHNPDLLRQTFITDRPTENPSPLKLKGYLREQVKQMVERLILAR